jgi:hypothetical protein
VRIFISAISLALFAKLKSDPDVFADALVPLEALQLVVRAAILSRPNPCKCSLVLSEQRLDRSMGEALVRKPSWHPDLHSRRVGISDHPGAIHTRKTRRRKVMRGHRAVQA